jgi:hypothetical protein
MAQFNITITEELLHGLFLSNGRDEPFSKLLEEIFNQVLLAQSSEQVGAEPYERTEERTAYRNGFRDRQMTSPNIVVRVFLAAFSFILQLFFRSLLFLHTSLIISKASVTKPAPTSSRVFLIASMKLDIVIYC